jgi:hypothetical protein
MHPAIGYQLRQAQITLTSGPGHGHRRHPAHGHRKEAR